MSNHSLVAPDPGAGIDAQRPGATLSGKHLRKGASAVLAGVLTLGLALGGSSVAAQAAVGGGGSGGGGTGSGTGAADYWLFTGDNYDGYNTPDQGWGNASIDYFANAMEQQGSWPYGDRSHMDTACGNAIDQAIARSNGASTRARVVQVGTGVNQYDGYTVMAWGGTQSGMTSWYNGLTSDNYWQPYLVGYDASVLDDVHDTFVSNIPSSNPRVVCVALNETEGAPRDYTLSLSTDKSAVFSVAGSSKAVSDTINASANGSDIRENVTAKVQLNWGGVEGYSAARTKNVTIANSGKTQSKLFRPSDFGWSSWPAGDFWFNVTVAKQGKMAKSASHAGKNDSRESWNARKTAPRKVLTSGSGADVMGSTEVLASGMFYNAEISARTNGYGSSMTITDTIGTDKVWIGSSTQDDSSKAYVLDPNGNKVSGAKINISRAGGKVAVSGTVTSIPTIFQAREYKLVVPTYMRPTKTDYTINDDSDVCYTPAQISCIDGNNKQTRKVTATPDKVWVLDAQGALSTADPSHTNNAGVDNKTFAPGAGIGAVVNGSVPARLAENLSSYSLTDDWTGAAKYIDFSDASKARVYLNGADVTSQFTITVSGTKTIATAKAAFLSTTKGLSQEKTVKLYIGGTFKTNYDTDGALVKLTNSGSEKWNNETVAANTPAIYTTTPDPDKVWVLDAQGALSTSDPNGTNNAGVDNKTFAPGAGIGAVVNGSVPANLGAKLTEYSLTDNWTGSAKYIDFTDASKARVFLDGADVTSQFTITVSGTKTIAKAKAAFLDNTKGLSQAKTVKLYIGGTFKTNYDTDGALVKLTNSGSESWNGKSITANTPAIYTVTADPDKAWVLDEQGALTTSDPNGTNNVGVDNKTFAPGASISAVVNGSVPANLGAKLTQYSLTDDWTGAAKYINFTDASKARVFLDGVNVTDQFTITVSGTKTIATAKAAFLDNTKGLPQARNVKLYVTGTFKTNYDTDGSVVKLTNSGSESWNGKSITTNTPAIYTVTPDPDKAWVLNEQGALTTTDPNWTNTVGADNKTFAPGSTISAVVNGSVPANLGAKLTSYVITDDWTGSSKYIDFSNASKAKVFLNGADVTNQFTITVSGTKTIATAKAAFLDNTKGLSQARSVKLYVTGNFRSNYDTDGTIQKLTNSGSESWNGKSVATNSPAIYTVTPAPDKVWVLDQQGALDTFDPNGTNNAGADNKTFAPGASISAVVNGSVPANLGSDLTEYSITDDWTGAAKYIDFSDASKAKVFLDGVNVTSQFTVTVSGTKTVAKAKPVFLSNTSGRASAATVKLYVTGTFKNTYDTDGDLERLTNSGSESWNGKSIITNSPAIYTVTPDPDKVWVLDQQGALATADPDHNNTMGVDNKTFAPGSAISAVVNGSVPANLGKALTSYEIADDWTGAAKYIDFSDASKAKVFLNGVNVTNQFTVTVSGTRTIAKAKAAFLNNTLNRATEGAVKLYVAGTFKSNYDTDGKLVKFTNAGWEKWNGKQVATNSPALFTVTPDPDKAWVLNEQGALTTADQNGTNTAGVGNKTFAPGSTISAVVNGSIPANLGSKLASYVITDDWSGAAKYVDFSDASKVKVFLDGVNVTGQFDIMVSGTKTVATAKPAFLDKTRNRSTAGVVKLFITGAFKLNYDTDGKLAMLTNEGSEAWNGKSDATNTPALFTVTPDPNKAWVLDEKGALATADPNGLNTVGADNMTFAPGESISAVVNGSVPANLGSKLSSYVITDDWTDAAKYVDFTDASKAKVFLNGAEVTSQFDIVVSGTKTIATAKAAFLDKTLNRPSVGVVKLLVTGEFRNTYDTNGAQVQLTNTGSEAWNGKSDATNTPAVFTVTPDPNKAWVLDEQGALAAADGNWTNTAGVANKTFAPGSAISAVVNGSVPANLGKALRSYVITDDWTGAAKYIDFSDASKAKVFLDGVNVTDQFTIKVSGTKTIATAKAEFLGKTLDRSAEGVVKFYVTGAFRNDYDTDGKLDRFTNAGSEKWNNKEVETNTPALFTVTPDPDKAWVLDEQGALVTADGDWTNTAGVANRTFAPGASISAVVNGSVPANLGSKLGSYEITDDWTGSAKYIDFSDASKAKVFLDGVNVTDQFTIKVSGTKTIATAKAAFLNKTLNRSTEAVVKLLVTGEFRNDYDTNGKLDKLTNTGTEKWNNKQVGTNSPALFTVTPTPDKVWVLDEQGALSTSDQEWGNTSGSDQAVFLQNDAVSAVVNGSIPANLGSALYAYTIVDDWSESAKYVDFSDVSRVKVFYNGTDVTDQFDVRVDGTRTVATAKDAFLANTEALTKEGAVKLVISGTFRDDYDTNGEIIKITNTGSETWNNRTEPTNEPPVFVWTPDPNKQVLGSAEESGDLAHGDINGTSVWPGQKLEYSVGVDLRIPAGTARGLKSLVVEDVYDPYFVPDKTSVEFWDSRDPRNPRPVPRSAYQLRFNEVAHTFTATFTQAWIDANVSVDGANSQWLSQGWLTMRFTGGVSAVVQEGSTVVNQAFQIINGARTATEIPAVQIPTVTPDKESLNTDHIDIDGKTVVEGDVVLYRLTMDGGPGRSQLAYNVHKLGMVDDFDEDFLKLSEADIAVTEKATGLDVTDKFNVQVKGGKAYVFAKTVDTVGAYGETIPGDPQAADLAAFDAAAIRPLEDPIIDQSLLGKEYWVTLRTTVAKEETDYVIKNTAIQNIQNTYHATKTVSNPLKDIDPTKDVVVAEETKDASINGAEVKMYSTFNYRLNSSSIPANRAYKVSQWSMSDQFDRVHDMYTGIWAVYADEDIYQGDELIFKKGDLLADSAAHESEPWTGLFEVSFDEGSYTFNIVATQKYLDLVETRGDLANAFSVYTKMQRIAPSERIENKVTESYNEFTRASNTAWTFTHENPAIEVENFTLSEGQQKGDRDDVRLAYEMNADQLKLAALPKGAAKEAQALQNGVVVGINVVNSGDVPLKNLKLANTVNKDLYGDPQGLMCAVPADPTALSVIQGSTPLEADKNGMVWVMPSAVTELGYGQSLDCQSTLRGMEPGMTHGSTAMAEGESVFTGKLVMDEDAWFAKAPSKPAIDIVKYTLDEGQEKGDRNAFKDALVLTPEQAANGIRIGFGVTNTGDEPLTEVVFEDITHDATTGKVEDVKWLDPVTLDENGKAAGNEDAAVVTVGAKSFIERPLEELKDLAIDQSVLLVGTLKGMEFETGHTNMATITAKARYSGTAVQDSDAWNAKATSAPGIDIVKYTLDEGQEQGDRNTFAEALALTPEQAANGIQIGFGISNTGDEPLKNIVFKDETIDTTTGKIEGVKWLDRVTAQDASNASDAGVVEIDGKHYIVRPLEELAELAVGETVLLVGTVMGVEFETAHTDLASVSAEAVYSGKKVEDSDPWNAKASSLPSVDIINYTLDEGQEKGDRNTFAEALPLTPEQAAKGVKLGFGITNTGDEPLKGLVFTNETIDTTTGKVEDVKWLDPVDPDGDAAQGAKQDAGLIEVDGKSYIERPLGDLKELAIDESVLLTGIMKGIKFETAHTDLASITATAVHSGKKVSDSDPWNATVTSAPGIDIINYTLDEGREQGDRNTIEEALALTPEQAVQGIKLGFGIANTGDEPLTGLDFTNITSDATTGKVEGVKWLDPVNPDEDPAKKADSDATVIEVDGQGYIERPLGDLKELAVGQSVLLTGTMKGIEFETAHIDVASIKAEALYSTKKVEDSDPWNATVTSAPSIDIINYTLEEGREKGDRNTFKEALVLSSEQGEKGLQLGFGITNTGDEPLTGLAFKNETFEATTGKVEDVKWLDLATPVEGADEVPEKAEAATIEIDGESYIERPLGELKELAIGETVLLVGTLKGVEPGTAHVDQAMIAAEAVYSTKKVEDSDPWNGKLGPLPVPPPPAPEPVPAPPKPEPKGAVTGIPVAARTDMAGLLFGGAAALMLAAGIVLYSIRRRVLNR